MSTPEVNESTDSTEPEQKKRKVMSEEALAKLAVAREKAAQVNRAKKEERLRAKVKALDNEPPPVQDPILVVEQSESDDEQLDGPPGVLFVRRRRQKPKPPPDAREREMDMMFSRMFPLQ